MEAVKKLPMISFELKNSPEPTSFHNLKQCIAEYYGEDPDSYAKEFRELEELRGLACRPRIEMNCCATVKRYYAQLHSLQNRFPLSSDTDLLSFAWRDLYSNSLWHTNNIKYEMAAVLYNIAALHSKLGVEEERNDPESMKLACTHFQCAAWAYGEMKNQYGSLLRGDLAVEILIFKQQICFAQAQECILEKSLADNRKAAIIAKVTAQVISFYNAAMTALFSQNEDGSIQDMIGSKLYKEWQKYIKFKTAYLSAVLFLYQGQNSEEQRKMGERVALYNAACDRLEEAKKEVKGMNHADAINEAMVLATDIIEGKRKNAKQENEFIYHEMIPEISSISAVQGANLVQGIPFDVTDAQIIGDDIFKRLVPMKTHENLSLYSEEKANILRRLGAKIDERDTELASFMGSLNMDLLNSMKQSQERLPQNLVDRCAELSAKPNAISDLVESMSNLANICTEVEISLSEIKKILDEESKQEQNYQKQMGKRPTGHIMTELTREFTKYSDAHSKASESNDTLRKAMELHVSNLKILAQPLSALRTQVPQSDAIDENVRKDLENLLGKVEEMKGQRDVLYEQLRDQILNKDDITAQLLAHGEKDVDELFKKELKKYSQSVNIIEQNLVAQGNILKALTDTYAKHAMTLKAFNDAKARREQFYGGLIGSFDVYEDLIGKSSKGLDFYKKLHANIQKLLSRVKAARDVQEEERQELLKTVAPKIKPEIKSNFASSISMNPMMTTPPISGGGPKLKDYIKSGLVPGMGVNSLRDDLSKLPGIRPSPVGQENIPTSIPTACSTVNYPTTTTPSSAYNAQYMQQYYNNMYTNQQFYQQPTADQRSLHDASSSLSSSSTSLNSDNYALTNQAYNQQQQPQQQSAGYVNPIYQQGNQYYSNMYSQMGYGNQQQQPNSAYQSQQFPQSNMTMESKSLSNNQMQYGNQQSYQTGVQSNLYNTGNQGSYAATQQYSQNPSHVQQYQQPAVSMATNQPQQQQQQQQQNNAPQYQQANSVASGSQYQQQFQINPVNTTQQFPQTPNQQINYPATNQQSFAAPTSQYPQYSNQSNLPPTQQYPAPDTSQQQQYQNQTINASQPATDHQYQNPQSMYSQGEPQQAPQTPSVETPKQQVDSQNQNQTGNQLPNEFIKNIYKSQLQYPNVQSPTTQNSIPNQYANATPPASSANSQYSYGQYNEQVSQQNYSCYTPVANSINSYMSAGTTTQPNVTQSVTYSQKPDAATTNYDDSSLQNQTTMINSAATIATASNGAVTHSTNSQQNQVISPLEKKTSANFDLLSGIDFSMPSPTIDNIPMLTPIKKNETPTKVITPQPPAVTEAPQTPIKMNSDLADLDFASLNLSPTHQVTPPKVEEVQKPKIFEDPFEDVNVLKQFHKEVESLEKYMETLTVKTLSGITPLANKWKELQDLLVREESSRSISVAKLFPDKNRFTDSLPYDHGRVLLPTATDNYINAVMVKDCGPITFIMAQTPMENTINDWWEMVWSQKSKVLVCLHSSSELLDPFWPQNVNEEKSYGEISVTLLKQFELSHCFEKTLKVTRHGSEVIANISLLQVKTWKKKSADHIVDVSSNIITSYKQQSSTDKSYTPIILNCINGSTERCGLITLGISAVLATQMKKPNLLNVVDHWFRVCSQRKGVMDDESFLQLSLQIVLNNAHRILNKRGIMTSYQVKNAEKLSSPIETEKTVKDSLQELDPFWKFK